MKVLIAGLGSAGLRHLRNLHALGIRDLLAFRVRGHQAEDVERFGVSEYYDLEEALDQRPGAVIVSNPTSSHMEVALAAARRGCHIFVEKPLANDLAGVDDLIDIVREQRLTALVGCNFRFNRGLQRVREHLEQGRLGKVVTARAHAGEYLPDWHPGEDWRAGYSARQDLGGGVILTVIHELDYLCWLFGHVSGVFAMAGGWSHLQLDVEDATEMLVEFSSGVHASIHLDYIQRPRARTLEVIAERGTIRWDFYAGRLAVYAVETGEWTEWTGASFDDRNEMYIDEMRHFFECIANRSQPAVPLEEGKRVLEIALAAKQSSATQLFVRLQSAGPERDLAASSFRT